MLFSHLSPGDQHCRRNKIEMIVLAGNAGNRPVLAQLAVSVTLLHVDLLEMSFIITNSVSGVCLIW